MTLLVHLLRIYLGIKILKKKDQKLLYGGKIHKFEHGERTQWNW